MVWLDTPRSVEKEIDWEEIMKKKSNFFNSNIIINFLILVFLIIYFWWGLGALFLKRWT